MKNIKYIVMLAVMAVMATFTSCMQDNNDWDVDPSANGNRTWAPLELNVEKGDTYLKLFGFSATNASGYVAQVSKLNFDEAKAEDILEYKFGKVKSTDSVIVDNLVPKTTYYVRIKATAEGKEDSQWVQYRSSKGEYTVKTTALEAASFEINFVIPAEGQPIPAYWHDGAFTLYRTDANDKMVIDASNKTFDGGTPFTARLKSGGKSSDANSLRISCSVKGTLTVYAFGGSSTKNSSLVMTQNGNEVLSVSSLPGSGDGVSYEAKVRPGIVEITYPENSVNFYGFKFVMDDGETYVEDQVIEPEPEPTPEPEPEPTPSTGFEGTFTFGGMSSETATANAAWGTVAFDGGEVPSLSATGGTELTLAPNSTANIIIAYTNSGDKANVFKCAANFLAVDSKNGIIKINNLAVDQTIKVTFTAKGSSPAILTAYKGVTGADVTSETTADSKTAVFKSTAASVQLKETNGGMRIYSVEVTK